MKRNPLCHLLFVLFALGALPSQSALSTEVSQMMRDAVAHHDQGDFDGAIALLEQVTKLEPENAEAGYELAFSHQAKGDLQSCVEVAERYIHRLDYESGQAGFLPLLSMLQASCLSAAGDTIRALKVFRAAIAQKPDDYGLNFNIAITLLNEGEYTEAILHLQTAIRSDPSQPSPYYVIGKAHQAREHSVKSLLAYLTFLQLEFDSPRCATAASAAIDVAYSRVRPDASGSGTTIFLSPTSESDSPDIATLTLTLALAAVASAPNGKIKEPIAESIAELLQRFISIVAELELESDPDSFLNSYLLPNIFRIEEADVTSAFSYFVLSSAGISGASEWLDSHPDETDELVAYFELLPTNGN